jgi:hypothetical protein
LDVGDGIESSPSIISGKKSFPTPDSRKEVSFVPNHGAALAGVEQQYFIVDRDCEQRQKIFISGFLSRPHRKQEEAKLFPSFLDNKMQRHKKETFVSRNRYEL